MPQGFQSAWQPPVETVDDFISEASSRLHISDRYIDDLRQRRGATSCIVTGLIGPLAWRFHCNAAEVDEDDEPQPMMIAHARFIYLAYETRREERAGSKAGHGLL